MKLPENPRIILAGSVNSSLTTLNMLAKHKMNLVGVLGLSKDKSKNVSGYQDLSKPAEKFGVPYSSFDNINGVEPVEFISSKNPDLLFVVGLSQLVKEELLNIPKYGCIGFHPTKLPKGRGRGAVAWILLGKAKGAATFFKLDEGMDSGPILIQEPFQVNDDDYASNVIDKIILAIEKGLDKTLPDLKNGVIKFQKQDHKKATYLGRRRPEDGYIDWEKSANEIHTLIRATSKPLPGAFTYFDERKVVINKAEIVEKSNHIGVTGRISKIDESGIEVHTGEGQILIQELQGISKNELSVGRSFGINLHNKVEKLEQEVKFLKSKLSDE